MAALPPLIPDNAPFNTAQRAWLNGFFAGLLNLDQMGGAAAGLGPALTEGAAALAGMSKEAGTVPQGAAEAAAVAGGQDEDFDAPWHDPALELPDRMDMAKGRPLPQRLMAAMGQLDCGQCGYDCKAYALKLADGSEAKQNLCVPGGRATQKKVKELLNERGSADQISAEAAVSGNPSGLNGTLAGANGHATPARASSGGITGTAVAAAAAVTAVAAGAVVAVAGIGRANPVTAMLKAAKALNAPDSEKDTRHVVIDLEGTGISYKPGDSLGVIPENDPELVDGVVSALGALPETETAEDDGPSRPLRAELLTRRDLRNPTDALFALLAEAATDRDEAVKLSLLADGEDPGGDLETLDVLDVLEHFPSARPPAKAVVAALDELQPRLYSISSSPKAHAGEVHLTVGVVHDEKRGRKRRGVASNHLGRVNGTALPLQIYLQPSHGFALPADDAKPVVMVGPGTGIAPFRAFLHERKARGAKGRSWLFFGNPYGGKDFLYREELDELAREGVLTRLDTAFSRDQSEKVYVQHRILEAGPDLWSWLQEGAHVYVCGDAKRMASDVDKALREVACRHGGMDEARAKAWLKQLADAGRYQRDVY